MNKGRQHQARGNRTEAKVTSELMELGVSVSAPVFGNERYDFIIDHEGNLERVQVKTAHDDNGRKDTVVVGFESTIYQSNGKPNKTHYTADEIDSYVIYCPKQDCTLYVPFDETPRTQMNFSFRSENEYNTHNRKAINFAKDYELATRLGRE